MSEILQVLAFIKSLPEGITLVLVAIAWGVSFFLKRKDVDLTQITTISEMQTEQLSKLIKQNTELSHELSQVRKELREAYNVIDDMRQRITELEQLVAHHNFNQENHNGR